MVEQIFFHEEFMLHYPKTIWKVFSECLPVYFEFNNSSRHLLINHICQMMVKVDQEILSFLPLFLQFCYNMLK